MDRELLFAAALLHDVGLPTSAPQVDFTRASARVARDVAEQVGLSTAASDILRSAITLHHTPGVTPARGQVAYLLSAGAALDVVGLRSWQLAPELLAAVLAAHPRVGFKPEFAAAFRTEAARVPRGRAAFLRRHACHAVRCPLGTAGSAVDVDTVETGLVSSALRPRCRGSLAGSSHPGRPLGNRAAPTAGP